MARKRPKKARTTRAAPPPKPAAKPKVAAPDKRNGNARPSIAAAPAPTDAKESSFPIVGIGASAGGLEALEEFLRNVPANSGIAYVVVQHLDPTPKGMLVELLQRATSMPVAQATDRKPVERDHVYVIPPNSEMSLLHGTLHLLPLAGPRGLNLPIDFFFRSLAEDQQERSIGVILSGMGSDGTLGLRAIKEKAGAAFVQSLTSAKFDGMPRSAIDAALADVIAPVGDLPDRIVAYCRHAHITRAAPRVEEKAQTALEKIFVILGSQTGNDFSLYKRSTIQRRIERRMGLHQIEGMLSYVRFLRENPAEVELLFKELLIGVTNFFRDPSEWDALKRDVLPTLISMRSNVGTVRAWVAGCSTGKEAFSLASNLLDNARKFSPAGGRVELTLQRRGSVAHLRVGDTGAGIAKDLLPRVFEPFMQGPQALDRARGGLGLGLAMVKGFIELHGGTVAISSGGPGHGTEIGFTLPLSEAGTVAAPKAMPRLRSRRVLVIEDQPDSAHVLETALAMLGLEVRVAANGPIALELAREFHPEIVLCDLGLPGMDGHEIARRFRRDRELASIYLVALSGYAQPDDVARATAAGFSRHLAKPASIDAVARVIAEAP